MFLFSHPLWEHRSLAVIVWFIRVILSVCFFASGIEKEPD